MMKKATTLLGIKLEDACKFSGTVTASTPTELLSNFVNALADYIENNIKYAGTFSGTTLTNPPVPYTSPVTEGKLLSATLRSMCPVCKDPNGESGEVEWTNWMNEIYTGIKATQIIGTSSSIPITATISFPSLVLGWSRKSLLDAYDNNDSIYDTMADNIILDLKKSVIMSYPSIITGVATGADTIAFTFE